jgi:hypothetical protein
MEISGSWDGGRAANAALPGLPIRAGGRQQFKGIRDTVRQIWVHSGEVAEQAGVVRGPEENRLAKVVGDLDVGMDADALSPTVQRGHHDAVA